MHSSQPSPTWEKERLSLYENITFSFSVPLPDGCGRSAVDVPRQRGAHRHIPRHWAARVSSREMEISDRSTCCRFAGDRRQGRLLRKWRWADLRRGCGGGAADLEDRSP